MNNLLKEPRPYKGALVITWTYDKIRLIIDLNFKDLEDSVYNFLNETLDR